MEAAAADLANESHLGFDTETRPSFKKGDYYPPALIQLATERRVYLFRISKTENFDPLLPILESPDILKTGVAIKDDVKELRAMEDFTPCGFVEIADITVKLGYEKIGVFERLQDSCYIGASVKQLKSRTGHAQNLTTSKFAMRRPMRGSAAKFIVWPWQNGIEKLKPKLPSLSVTKKPRTREVSNWPF